MKVRLEQGGKEGGLGEGQIGKEGKGRREGREGKGREGGGWMEGRKEGLRGRQDRKEKEEDG